MPRNKNGNMVETVIRRSSVTGEYYSTTLPKENAKKQNSSSAKVYSALTGKLLGTFDDLKNARESSRIDANLTLQSGKQ